MAFEPPQYCGCGRYEAADFSASELIHGEELWKSTGTNAGIVFVGKLITVFLLS